jgi:thiol-disulfide isomerase/thioredoxin
MVLEEDCEMMKILPVLLLLLSGCADAVTPAASKSDKPDSSRSLLRDLGPAPELNNKVWLNTPAPIHLADLRGKVILLEMWTFDCINCQHTLPTLNSWYEEYASQRLVIIGNHYPEFPYEANLENLKNAVKDDEINYPVAQDNEGTTWNAYKNKYWPTMYLIDKKGEIRYVRIGEGGYDLTEAAIQSLLAEQYP